MPWVYGRNKQDVPFSEAMMVVICSRQETGNQSEYTIAVFCKTNFKSYLAQLIKQSMTFSALSPILLLFL
jgi:hypothetical protein